MERKRTVLALVGSTCTGKTALSISLAQKLAGEIIACDSRTVYRYLDIGTAKPTMEERQGVPHHLIDMVEPSETYSAAQFAKDSSVVIEKILAAEHCPIVCGGTGFYARALLEGLKIPAVQPQPELREELANLARQHGNRHLWERLYSIDKTTAEKLNENDLFRIIRALEVFNVTGQPFSQVAQKETVPYEVIWCGLRNTNRGLFLSNIKERFHQQMKQGMLEETQALFGKYGANQTIFNTVNYKQLIAFLRGECSMTEVEELAITHNYQLGRRQYMWFKTNKNITWFSRDEQTLPEIEKSILKLCQTA